MTQESLAQRLGKGQSTIANKLRLLHLPETVREALRNRKVSERHARALLALQNEEWQLKILQEIMNRDLNVKQTELRVKQFLEQSDMKSKPKPKRISFSRDVRLAVNTIRQSIDMIAKNGLVVTTDEEDHEEYYQFTIKVPKQH